FSASHSIARALSFIPGPARGRWLLLVVISLALSGLEATAAVGVFALVQGMSGGLGAVPQGERIREFALGLGVGDPVVFLAGLVAGFYAFKNLLSAFALYYRARVPLLSGAEFARTLFSAYLHAPYPYHLRRNSAEILRNMQAVVDVVFKTVLFSLAGIVAEGFVVVALLLVVLIKAPGTTLVAILCLGTVAYGLHAVARPWVQAWGKSANTLSAATIQATNQGLGGLKDLRLLGVERYFIEAFATARFALTRSLIRTSTIESLPRLVLETLLVVVMVVVVVAAKGLHEADGDLVPLVGLYAYTGFRVMPSLNRILVGLQHIRFGSPSVEEIDRDLRTLSGFPSSARSEPVSFRDTFTLADVRYTYPETSRPALNGVTLHLKRGQTVGVVGGTGAGKSTLVDVVLGLLKPETGDILVDGVSVCDDMGGWQRLIGYVPQSIFLLDDTLRRNIAFGIEDDAIDERRVAEVLRLAQLEAFVESLPESLETKVGERGVRLSGGQRQRVAIARALYGDPEVLILDEATAALDNRTEKDLSEAIERLAGHKTMMIVAHRLDTIRHCDLIVVLRAGRIVDSGTYEALLADSEAFRDMVAST
ncbi:MAG: ABC transporter ATP-binding protein, partial [Alphaproteobacteria bacterium]